MLSDSELATLVEQEADDNDRAILAWLQRNQTGNTGIRRATKHLSLEQNDKIEK